MLVLQRSVNESVVIDGGIRIKVVKIVGTRVTLGIEAPDDVRIVREEIIEFELPAMDCGPICLELSSVA